MKTIFPSFRDTCASITFFSLALFTVHTAGAACIPPPPGLVSWWRGEGNALDSVDGNNGTLLDGTTFVAGEVGQGFSFATTNGGVRMPASANLNVGTNAGFTIEGWINPTNVSDLYGFPIA